MNVKVKYYWLKRWTRGTCLWWKVTLIGPWDLLDTCWMKVENYLFLFLGFSAIGLAFPFYVYWSWRLLCVVIFEWGFIKYFDLLYLNIYLFIVSSLGWIHEIWSSNPHTHTSHFILYTLLLFSKTIFSRWEINISNTFTSFSSIRDLYVCRSADILH